MKLSEAQRIFSLNLAKLILWIYDNGMECTLGEVLRTTEQQEIYITKGLSKTMNSGHLKKLAADINLFIDGVYKTDRESYHTMAEYWKTLHPKNIAGYDWGWDSNHVEFLYE